MTRQLILLRHAKSSWNQPDRSDHDRPLNARGRRQAPQVGAWLQEEDCLPDLVLCSSALRARETLAGVAGAVDWDAQVRIEPDLYGAEPEAVLELVAWLGDQAGCVLVLGHNPGLSLLASRLAGREIALRTACLARFSVSVAWPQLLREPMEVVRFLDFVCPGCEAVEGT